jgi:hypothetical protein
MTLIEIIKASDNQKQELREILGSLLALLEVNIERGNLHCDDMDRLNALIANHKTRFEAIQDITLTQTYY